MLALIGVIAAVAGGATISAALAGLTITDWLAIAVVLIKTGEGAVKLFVALHPALKLIEADLMAKEEPALIAAKAAALNFLHPSDPPSVYMPMYNDPSSFGG